MRSRLLILAALSGFLIAPLTAQDLSPRAYVITPVHSPPWTLDYRCLRRSVVLTTNPAYYSIPEPLPQSQSPLGSFEGHFSHDFPKERMWASLDGNFWYGGATALSGIRNLATRQTGSRIGGTFSLPFSKHQSLKFSYSDGTYIRFGGNYQNVSVAWQYSWNGKNIR